MSKTIITQRAVIIIDQDSCCIQDPYFHWIKFSCQNCESKVIAKLSLSNFPRGMHAIPLDRVSMETIFDLFCNLLLVGTIPKYSHLWNDTDVRKGKEIV